jgi:lipopolysaccharide export system permease protein
VKILSRYLLKEHLGPFGYALSALTGFMLLNQLARQFGNLVGKGLSWLMIAEVFGLSVPFILAMTLPMAVLVAVLHAFTRLGADSEVVAMKASGVNLARLLRPVLVAASVIAVLAFLFIDQVLPRANHRLKTLLVDIARKKPTFELQEQVVNEVTPGQLFLRAGRIDQAADRLKDVVIYDLANDQRRRTIYADSGYMRFNADRTDLHLTLFDGYVHDYDRAQAGTFRRVFFRTDLVRVRGVSNRFERTEEDDFKSDREMSVCEMEGVVAADRVNLRGLATERVQLLENDARALVGARALPMDRAAAARPQPRRLMGWYCAALGHIGRLLGPPLRPPEVHAATGPADPPPSAQERTPRRGSPAPTTRAFERRRLASTPDAPMLPPRTVTAAPAPVAGSPLARSDPEGARLRSQLLALTARERNARQHAARYAVEIHKKFSIAAACVVFVLIGAPIALRFPRGGVGLTIGASFVIFGFYYIGLIGGETLADQLVVPPFWAMWTPNLLMLAVGLVLFSRLGREHATARGGEGRLARLLGAGRPA